VNKLLEYIHKFALRQFDKEKVIMTEQVAVTITHANPDGSIVKDIPVSVTIGDGVYLDEFYDDVYDEVISSPGGLVAVGRPCRSYRGIEFGVNVRIGNETVVRAGALGDNTVIGAQCVIEGAVSANSVVGNECRIYGSVGADSTVGVGVYVHADAYLADGMTIPDGSIVVPTSETDYLPDDIASSPLLIVVADLKDRVE